MDPTRPCCLLGSVTAQPLKKIELGKYVLILIDPIYKGLGGRDENSAGDISELCNELERLAVETGAAVLYAAHFTKGNQAGKAAIDRIGGSGVFTRDADTIITLTPHATEGAHCVELILRNLPHHKPFVMRWECPLMVYAPDLDPADLKTQRGRKKKYAAIELLSYIKKTTVTRPISIIRWAELAGIVRQSLSEYLPGMRSKGWIRTVGEGTGARQYITKEGQMALDQYGKAP